MNTQSPSADDRNPWIGLDSFTEETRGYFFGREEEVAELARRVQRKLLTVLFGQSGLGKTSILRAGLVPRLRGQGYCPIYVRIDYSAEAPEPAEQIKQAILRTARHSGQWTQSGVAIEGETLWEFLHHRDDVLLDETGKPLIPLLIFDQFEEIFTLAQSDEAGRRRAATFITDLADLVENRPPSRFEARLDADDALAERFDFARSDYRVLISLREDYLAPLEGLKSVMPSITQNRLRLAPMTGKQGLAAVMGPGKQLVNEEVAAAIVRFVAGGSEIANAEVEPALLSLVCRELNDTRIAQGRSEISLDLLAGTHATILSNFYERALIDEPAAVRRVIEDDLLTDSGFRESVAEERLQRAFTAAGAAPDTLATLVNRRLLRIEERLDVRRVELTHDVLCAVVKGSRDVRHEREAREATERQLAEQHERAIATRHALVRARQVAAVCIVLALGAVAAAVYAYWSTQRAQRAEAMAQQSRAQAEQLLAYLTDDFARELERSGRLDVVAKLAQREIEYFHALPDELKGPTTVRTGAVAMIQYARASRSLGRLDEAEASIDEAEKLVTALREGGDDSADTTAVLARTLGTRARIRSNRGQTDALPLVERAASLLEPLASAPGASPAVQEAYVETLVQLAYQQQANFRDADEPVATARRAMALAESLGARNVENAYMANKYAEAGAWAVQALVGAGRGDEARGIGTDASDMADRVLASRPNDMLALYAQGIIQSNLAGQALDDLQPKLALDIGRKSEAVHESLVGLDPGNTIWLNNLAASRSSITDAEWALGNFPASLRQSERALEAMEKAALGGPRMRVQTVRYMNGLARRYIDLDDLRAAEQVADRMQRQVELLRQESELDSNVVRWAEAMQATVLARIALTRRDADAALAITTEWLPRIEPIEPQNGEDRIWRAAMLFFLHDLQAHAQYALGRPADSERSARAALVAREQWSAGSNFDKSEQAVESMVIARALVAQDKRAEAAGIMEPVVAHFRDLDSRNQGDIEARAYLASALIMQGLAEPQRRAALHAEARRILRDVPPDYRRLNYLRTWLDLASG